MCLKSHIPHNRWHEQLHDIIQCHTQVMKHTQRTVRHICTISETHIKWIHISRISTSLMPWTIQYTAHNDTLWQAQHITLCTIQWHWCWVPLMMFIIYPTAGINFIQFVQCVNKCVCNHLISFARNATILFDVKKWYFQQTINAQWFQWSICSKSLSKPLCTCITKLVVT